METHKRLVLGKIQQTALQDHITIFRRHSQSERMVQQTKE